MKQIVTLLIAAMMLSGCLVTTAAVTSLISVANEHVPAVKAIVKDIKSAFDADTDK